MKQLDELSSSAVWERVWLFPNRRGVRWYVYVHVNAEMKNRYVNGVRAAVFDYISEVRLKKRVTSQETRHETGG